YLRDVQKFPLRSNFCTSKRGLHPQLCQSVFAVAKTFNTSADWQNSFRKASFQRKLRQSALRCLQFQKKPSPKEMKSKFTIFFLLISIFIFSQNDDLSLWRKYESYKKLDTINTFSKDYPTKLIEGSGIIKNKNKRTIGSIGFETEITRNRENRIVRIY